MVNMNFETENLHFQKYLAAGNMWATYTVRLHDKYA